MNDLERAKAEVEANLRLYNKSICDLEKLEKDIYFKENKEEEFIKEYIKDFEEITDKEKIEYFDSRYTSLRYELFELYEGDNFDYNKYIENAGKFEIFAKPGKNIYDFINKRIDENL